MLQRRIQRGAIAAGVLLAGMLATEASASPPPTPPTPVAATGQTPVATGLTNPRGFTWNPDGQLVVALAGGGGAAPPTEDTPTNAVIGPFGGGPTGAVVTIDDSSCPAAIVTGLPSTLDAVGGVLGPEDVAYMDGELYIGVDGGGAGHGNADQPSGIYRIADDGSPELVADLSAWVRENPVANIPGDYDPDAAGYSLVVEPSSNTLWVGDPNSGQILSVTADGAITRVADLSEGHLVPTRMALDPAGGVFIGTLTTVPFPDGVAAVAHVGLDGAVEWVWTGLTTVVDVAVGADGALYALEMSTGNLAEPPFFTPMSGQIVRQTGPDTAETVAGGLMFPIAMELAPDGAFYVSTPAIGANDGSGAIVRIDPAGAPMTSEPAAAACTPIPETLFTPPPPPTGDAPPPDASAADSAAAASSVAPDSTDAAAATTAAPEPTEPAATEPAATEPAASEPAPGSTPSAPGSTG